MTSTPAIDVPMRAPSGPREVAARPAVAAATARLTGRQPLSVSGVLSAQMVVGNSAVARALAVQRQPQIPPPPPPAVSPEDRQKQLYSVAVTRDVHPIDAATKANVERAMSFAPVYADIEEKAQLQKDFDETNRQLTEANNQLGIKTNNVKDVAGAPGGSGPGSGEPEKASAELQKAKDDVARLSEKAQRIGDQLKAKQDMVSRELKAVGVKDEAELVTFIEETFPNSFIERGIQFAISALEANRAAALKERERYKQEHAGTGDRKGLQTAARDLDTRPRRFRRSMPHGRPSYPRAAPTRTTPG